MAQGDITRAARYLMAFQRGEQTDEAEAGAMLIADALVTIRNAEGVLGFQWKNGRPGI